MDETWLWRLKAALRRIGSFRVMSAPCRSTKSERKSCTVLLSVYLTYESYATAAEILAEAVHNMNPLARLARTQLKN